MADDIDQPFLGDAVGRHFDSGGQGRQAVRRVQRDRQAARHRARDLCA